MKYSLLAVGTCVAASVFASSMASAAPVTLQVCSGSDCWNGSYQIDDGVVVDWTGVETLTNGNNVNVDQWEQSRQLDISDWTMSMDSDPYVSNNFTVTNFTSSTQVYSLTATIGVTPAIPNGLMRGTLGYSLTDNNGGGATLSTSGASIYTGLIDGGSARTLWDPSTSFSTTPTNPTVTGNTAFGYPTREVAPQSIDSDIGINITFSLTAGDSVSFTSLFDVVPVPVPAAVWLFGSGLLGLIGIARRRG